MGRRLCPGLKNAVVTLLWSAGMLCPPLVPYSMLIGAVASWGIMWPVIAGKRGEW